MDETSPLASLLPIATIERGTTHWLARVLLKGETEPQWFTPKGTRWVTWEGGSRQLTREVIETYPGIRIVGVHRFEAIVSMLQEQRDPSLSASSSEEREEEE